jgi:aromatic ring-opening dioxygenase catalytic subunit (LigB family)
MHAQAKARKARCNAVSCDTKAEDQALVADGPRLHRLIQLAEKGDGTQKAHALAVVKSLEKRVQEDFSSVIKFGQTQEHALDSDKVKHDTALALTGEVAHHAALKLEARNAAEVSSWMSSGDAL